VTIKKYLVSHGQKKFTKNCSTRDVSYLAGFSKKTIRLAAKDRKIYTRNSIRLRNLL
jgi:hypothetical protein